MNLFDVDISDALEEAAAEEKQQTDGIEVLPTWHGQLDGIPAYHLEHMPHKILELFQAALKIAKTEYTFELFSIVFNDETVIDETDKDNPNLIQGTYLEEVKGIIVRTGSIWESVTEHAHNEKCNVSLLATLWINLMVVPLHELGHCIGLHMEEPDTSDDFAEEIANKLLVKLATRFDIEPVVEALPGPLKAAFIADIKACSKSGDAHLHRLVEMHKNGMIFMSQDGRIVVQKLRTYLQAVYKRLVPAEEWKQATVAVPALQTGGTEPAPTQPEASPQTPQTAPANNQGNQQQFAPPEYYNEPGMPEDSYYDGGEVPPPFSNPADQPNTPGQQDSGQTYIDDGMSAEQRAKIVHAVLMRIYTHMFTKCAPDGQGNFMNPFGVVEPISIADIPGAEKVFFTCENFTNAGKQLEDIWAGGKPGCITGSVGKNSNLPMYHLTMNRKGVITRVSVLPMNPNKTKQDGSPSAWATRVKQGHMLMMVIADDGPFIRIETAPGGDITNPYYGPAFSRN